MTSIPLDPRLLNIKTPESTPKAPVAAAPAAPTGGNGWFQTLLIIGAIIGGFVFLSMNDGTSVDPNPQPESVIESAESAIRAFAGNLATAMDAVAEEVDSGKISNPEQLKNYARTYTQAAREKAFSVLDQYANRTVPQSEWGESERKIVSSFLRDQSSGFKKAAK